jgi:predicted DNA-binding transcriptional regulator AlpA
MTKSKIGPIIDLINGKEFAAMIGISYPTFWKHKQDNPDFPPGTKIGQTLLWRKEIALKYIKSLGK